MHSSANLPRRMMKPSDDRYVCPKAAAGTEDGTGMSTDTAQRGGKTSSRSAGNRRAGGWHEQQGGYGTPTCFPSC